MNLQIKQIDFCVKNPSCWLQNLTTRIFAVKIRCFFKKIQQVGICNKHLRRKFQSKKKFNVLYGPRYICNHFVTPVNPFCRPVCRGVLAFPRVCLQRLAWREKIVWCSKISVITPCLRTLLCIKLESFAAKILNWTSVLDRHET